jgi:hypothetical protein
VRGERVRARGGGERERGSPPPFESSSLFLMECHFFTVIVMDWNWSMDMDWNSTMVHVVSRITNSEKETNVESRNEVVTGDGHKQECAESRDEVVEGHEQECVCVCVVWCVVRKKVYVCIWKKWLWLW